MLDPWTTILLLKGAGLLASFLTLAACVAIQRKD